MKEPKNKQNGNHASIKTKYCLLHVFLISLFLIPLSGFAEVTETTYEATNKEEQQRIITGTVSDVDGPLPGVSIVVKGTTNGTSTDFDGNYSINADGDAIVLQFSYIGYATKEITVGSQSSVNVTLEADAQSLDEVVVLGYTTRKRGELTGSVSTLNTEEIENTSNKDVAKSLAGKVSGLIVSDRGGYPGSNDDISLLIRGKSTLGNNSPLILIDGIAAGQGSFSQLSPQDIASISILKDGAAAIYGTRAANGVILVTTRRGKNGKPKINFSTSYGISSFSVAPKLMSSSQFATYENEIAERNGTGLPYSQEQINSYAAGTDPINFPNTDWADLTFAKTAPESRTSLSISGGSENVKYFVSGDLIDRDGMFASGDLNFQQKQIRSNLDITITDNFKIGIDLSGRFGETSEPGVDATNIYKQIYTNQPTLVGIYPNGLPSGVGLENGSNPYVMSSNASGFTKQIDNDLRSRFSFDWDLSKLTKGLSLNGYAGIRRMNNDQKSWYTPWTTYAFDEISNEYLPSTGFSQRGNERILRESFWKFDETLLNTTIRYANTFGDKHSLSGFLGYEQQSSNSRNFWAERRGFPTEDHPELFAGSDDGQQSSGVSSESATVSYFGSLSYDFDKKYFLDVTIRRDGSSNFGPGKRFGTFPGVAAAWALNKESFLEDVSWINALKIRASYAIMGNDRIGPFQYLTRYDYGSDTNVAQPNYYVFGLTGTSYNGYRSDSVPNEDVTWETAYMKNIGLSYTLFDNRLNGDINYFNQNREDILVTKAAAIPDAAGLTLPAENIGKVANYGWEFELSWSDQVNDNFSYNLGMNYTLAKNEVKYLAEALDTPDALKREGKPLDSYIIYPTNGIFRDQAQVDATEVKLNNTVEGEPIYSDTNGDGEISSLDRVRKFTSNVPQVQYGIFGGFKYKAVNFSFLLQGQAKAETLVFFDQSGAKPEYVFNQRWTPENRDSRYPRAFQQGDSYSGQLNNVSDPNFQGADLWLRDASFLRLKEVEIGYTLSKDVIKVGDIKLFVRGFNLLTMFSDVYKLGLDPEADGYNNFRGSTYPSLKTYTLGLNFTF
ncbi:SusC/RagA family TonB-linked outer membrane protein [Cellulophaga sp. Z1A5H]|uniref:SusC/RagA family TonB-linked outer membrane protein n=1 Tax=Cellulophaga sp. Z1A5H TaxID=2687291 RepID=UPI0013FDC333|nr:TonB-dependent receptor [Cellulophaga sp. Z1A5H]